MITDEKRPVARLIPISFGFGSRSPGTTIGVRAPAVMAAVPEFASALLEPLGPPSGRFETYIEVPVKL